MNKEDAMFTIKSKAKAISNDCQYPLSLRFHYRMIAMGYAKPSNEDKKRITALTRETREYVYYANGKTV